MTKKIKEINLIVNNNKIALTKENSFLHIEPKTFENFINELTKEKDFLIEIIFQDLHELYKNLYLIKVWKFVFNQPETETETLAILETTVPVQIKGNFIENEDVNNIKNTGWYIKKEEFQLYIKNTWTTNITPEFLNNLLFECACDKEATIKIYTPNQNIGWTLSWIYTFLVKFKHI